MKSVENFAIRFNLKFPLVYSGTVPGLDSIVSSAQVAKTGRIEDCLDIPLFRSDAPGAPFHGSIPLIQDTRKTPLVDSADGRSWPRRFNAEGDYSGVKDVSKKISSQRGMYRSLVDHYRTLFNLDLSVDPDDPDQRSNIPVLQVCYFGRGDRAQVEDLLRFYLPGIGKRCRRGGGEIGSDYNDILSFPVEIDQSLVRNGQPMRPIPVEFWRQMPGGGAVDSVNTDMVTWNPPYRFSERALCVIPPAPFLRDDVVRVVTTQGEVPHE